MARGDELSAIWLRDTRGYLRLPHAAMRDVGSAARTLGAVMERSKKKSSETFASAGTIAETAQLPLRTVRKHLDKLIDRGWVESLGRQDGRRTLTLRIPDETWARATPFGALPRWWSSHGRPAAGMVFSVVLSKLCTMEHLLEREDLEEEADHIRRMRRISFTELQTATGLHRETVSDALDTLWRLGHIRREESGPGGAYEFRLLQWWQA